MHTVTESELLQDLEGALDRVTADGEIAKLTRAQGGDVMLVPSSIWTAILTRIEDAVIAAGIGPKP